MNTPIDLLIIEHHNNDGSVDWLVSDEPNPTPDNCAKVASKQEAERIVDAAKRGIITPYLRACGATVI